MMWNRLKQSIKNTFYWPNYPRDWILGRHACLGGDVLKLLNNELPVLNFQKGRVDQFAQALADVNKKISAKNSEEFIERSDIKLLVRQQRFYESLPSHAPRFVYMDSYSELVDQLFYDDVKKLGFCCCFSDLKKDSNVGEKYQIMGLLPLEDISAKYQLFFKSLLSKYGDIPIIFINFSTALDARKKYKERDVAIKQAITGLKSEFKNLQIIEVDESLIAPAAVGIEADISFPYHFSERTKKIYAEKIRSTCGSLLR